MKPVDKYLNSIEFTNQCYLEIREVARGAYLAGYKDGSLSRRQEGDVDIPVGHVRDVSVMAWLKWCNYSPIELSNAAHYVESLQNFKMAYQSWSGKEVTSKRFASELRKFGYYVENIGGRIQVDVWVGGTVCDESEDDVKELPF